MPNMMPLCIYHDIRVTIANVAVYFHLMDPAAVTKIDLTMLTVYYVYAKKNENPLKCVFRVKTENS